MSSSADQVFGFGTTQIAIPAGVTSGLLIQPMTGQVNLRMKYVSGSSLVYMMGVASGATLSAEDLAGAANHYLLPTNMSAFADSLFINGPTRFYLAAAGATAVIAVAFGKSQGT